jgi:sulfhydrogenase subunit gamma (sulfur reductase)
MPYVTVVSDIKTLSPDSVLLTLKFREAAVARDFTFTPGQFIQLSLLGYGEIPVGLASNPGDRRHIQVSVRKVGNVTEAVHRLERGDEVGVRGPFGNGFKDEWIKGRHLLAVSGGCGLPPVRSLMLHAIENSGDFKGITLLYGSRTQQELLFRDEYEDWMRKADVLLTVDTEDAPDTRLAVDCGVGVVTKLIDKIKIADNMVAALCGPPIMYRFVVKKLLEAGMKPDNILVSLERRMKCGVGKCQHCTSGGKYVCLDGPVFTYKQVMEDYGGL